MLTITVQGARGSGEPRGRSRTARRWFSNWLVTDPSWVQWPVLCGRIASSLTSTRPSRVSNSSTASTPVTPSSPASFIAICCACAGEVGSQRRSRRDHLVADPVALRRGDHGPGGHLTGRRAGHQGGELALEVDALLGEDLPARLEGGATVLGALDEPDPLAVVPAAGGLQDAREAEGLDVRRPRRRARCAGTARRARPAGDASRPCPGRAPARPDRDGPRATPRARAGGRSARARGRR